MSAALSRRAFLKKSGLIAGGLAVLPHARVLGANDDIRIAVVGFRSKGMQHIGSFKAISGVRVVALCDVDNSVVAQGLKTHFADAPQQPKYYADVRKLLEDPEIDAVCIATPNHWHAPITVWACQAGKDVYCEKPCSHTHWEGQQIVAASHKHTRIVQIGQQNRSDPGLKAAFEHLRAGKLGAIQYVRAIYFNRREPIGKVSGPQQPPPEVDYNLWLGPAPDQPLMREKLHYDWHWQWVQGNGELGNNGVHLLDLASWLLDIKEFPERVLSVGGRFTFDDDGQTPNTHLVFYDYKPVPVFCEIRNLPRWKGDAAMDHVHGVRFGIEVKCEGGSYVGYGPGGWTYDNDGKKIQQFNGDGGAAHIQNFIDAVRSRKAESLAATPEIGHLAAGLCHIGNISHRLGQKANGVEIRKALQGSQIKLDALDRFHEHMLVNAADVTATPRILGAALSFSPETQRFTGDRADEANAMLTKTYREGFEIEPS